MAVLFVPIYYNLDKVYVWADELRAAEANVAAAEKAAAPVADEPAHTGESDRARLSATALGSRPRRSSAASSSIS